MTIDACFVEIKCPFDLLCEKGCFGNLSSLVAVAPNFRGWRGPVIGCHVSRSEMTGRRDLAGSLQARFMLGEVTVTPRKFGP